jgi:hypothetical protein
MMPQLRCLVHGQQRAMVGISQCSIGVIDMSNTRIGDDGMSGNTDSIMSGDYMFNLRLACVGHASRIRTDLVPPVACGSPRNIERRNPLNFKFKSNAASSDAFGMRRVLRAVLLAAPVFLATNAQAIPDCGSCVYPPPSGGHPASGTMACSACHTVPTPPPVVEPPVTPPPVVEPPVVEPPVVEPPVVEPPVTPPVTPPVVGDDDGDNDHDRNHKKDRKDKKDSKKDKKKSKSKDRRDD